MRVCIDLISDKYIVVYVRVCVYSSLANAELIIMRIIMRKWRGHTYVYNNV